MSANKTLSEQDLEKYISLANTILINLAALSKKDFENAYDNILVPILKDNKKRILLPKDMLEKAREYPNIFNKYLKIQKYIIESDYATLGDALKSLDLIKHKVLVFVGDKTAGNQVLRFKNARAIYYGKDGFSVFTKNATISQTARKGVKNLDTSKAQIKGNIPKTGDKIIYNDNGNISITKDIILQKELARGGEGVVYETNTKYIAKIYKLEERSKDTLKIPKYVFNKLQKFENVKLDSKLSAFIFLPLIRIYNEQNECVGFLMNKANAKPVQYLLGSSKEREKHYPNCEYKNLVKMCINYLKLTIELHKKDIIIGDVNMNNVLFDTQDNVYLIDCDSFQIDGYPCPVATQEFLHPTHRGKHMNDFVRNLADEYYAIAIFLFMMLHEGVYPYNTKGGLSRDDAQKDLKFPYADKSLQYVPKKGAIYWDKLDSKLKDTFINTFNKGGRYTSEAKILGPDKWLKMIQSFYKTL